MTMHINMYDVYKYISHCVAFFKNLLGIRYMCCCYNYVILYYVIYCRASLRQVIAHHKLNYGTPYRVVSSHVQSPRDMSCDAMS